MPAASVSQNSTRRVKRKDSPWRALLTHKWHQSHKASPFDGSGDGMLADRSATVLAAADDSAVPIDQFGQEVHILVIHVHRTRSLAVDEERILLFDLCASTRTLARSSFIKGRTWGKDDMRDSLIS